MDKSRAVGCRSFLARVAGGAVVAGAGLVFGAAQGGAQQRSGAPKKTDMLVDSDPRDPARPVPAGRTRPRPQQGFAIARPSPDPRPDSGISSTGNGRSNGPVQRFVVCPGNVRCPRGS